MNTITKLGLGALMLGGVAAASAAPAAAGVNVGVAVGVPGVAVGYHDPCFRPWRFRPAYCRYPVYAGPAVYLGGGVYRGPLRYRWNHGVQEFWFHDGWHRNDHWHR
jgi:hypothetical protein